MRGAKRKGAREEIETWMKHKDIKIAMIQETRIGTNSRESRKDYTWFLSGENQHQQGYTAGVGIVVKNDMLQHLIDIEPISDRVMWAKWKGTINITTICAHIPQAARNREDKEKVYEEIKKITRKEHHKGQVIVGADFNARIQKTTNENERRYIGHWTFEPDTARIMNRTIDILENRNLLIEYCNEFDMILANTLFQKDKQHTATYKEVGTTIVDEIQRGTHEQIDFITIQRRWRNNISNAESDTQANIESDHYPVWASFKLKVKAETNKTQTPRKKCNKCTDTEKDNMNKTLIETRKRTRLETEDELSHYKRAFKMAAEALPEAPKKLRKIAFSQDTKDILNRRQEAISEKGIRKYEELTKQFRKNKDKDRKEMRMQTIDKELDIRDKWLGITQLKTEYKPQPYHRSTQTGEHI